MHQNDVDQIQMSIGENIRSQREQRRISQKALAEAIGSGENTVAGWEKGRSIPPSDKIVAMAKLFECSTDEILLDSNERDVAPEMMALLRRFNELDDEIKPVARNMMSAILSSMEIEDFFRGNRGKPR